MTLRAAKLLFALLAIFLPAGLPAIAILVPDDRGFPPLELKSEVLDVTIDGPVARTKLEQTFHNPHPQVLEGNLVVTLPAGAQVTDVVMTMNGEKVHGDVLEATEARKVYTDIVRRMRDPGLLEHIDERTMSFHIFPIPANGDMPVELHFAQPLTREGDLYAFETASSRQGGLLKPGESDLKLTIKWPGGVGTVYSPTHTLDKKEKDGVIEGRATDYPSPDGRAFRLLLAPAQKDVALQLVTWKPEGAEEGAFMLLVHPPREGKLAAAMPKTVTFVLDTSGSMNEAGKIAQAKKALTQCIGGLGKDDQFNLLTFDTSITRFRESPIPATEENRAAAIKFIDEIRAHGGTNIDEALNTAVAEARGSGLHQVLFLTDGLPTVGTTDPGQILRHLEAQNKASLRVFALGVGYDVNTHLLDSIAESTRALSRYVEPQEDIEVKVSGLFDSISAPVLSELKLDVTGAETRDVYPKELPDLFQGQDLLVFGRYRGAGDAKVVLKGKAGAEPYAQEADASFPQKTDGETRYVAALWASRKVGYLLDEIRRNGETKELRDEVVALAQEYNLVTPYTSFLVVDDAELQRIAPLASAPTDRRARLYNSSGTVSRSDIVARERQNLDATGTPAAVITDKVPALPENRYRFTDALDLNATGGARNLADSTSAQVEYMFEEFNSSTGQAGVAASKSVQEFKEAAKVSGAPKLAEQRIDGATFKYDSGRWVQQVEPGEHKKIAVKYLSDAWFELVTRFPAKKKALQLGEKVTLLLGGYLVEIGDTGVEKAEELPKELK